jgi:sulfur carrier protein
MRIVLNGDAREVAADALDAALDELGYEGAVVATAVNGEFVPKAERGRVRLSDGDRLEVLAPLQGG